MVGIEGVVGVMVGGGDGDDGGMLVMEGMVMMEGW